MGKNLKIFTKTYKILQFIYYRTSDRTLRLETMNNTFLSRKKNFFYFTKQLNSFELYGRLNTSWSKNFIVIHSILYGMYKGKFNDSPKPRVKRIFSDLGQWAAPVLNFLIDRTTSSRLFNPAFSEAYSSADTMNNSVWSWSKPKPTFPRNHTRNKRYFDGIMWKC